MGGGLGPGSCVLMLALVFAVGEGLSGVEKERAWGRRPTDGAAVGPAAPLKLPEPPVDEATSLGAHLAHPSHPRVGNMVAGVGRACPVPLACWAWWCRVEVAPAWLVGMRMRTQSPVAPGLAAPVPALMYALSRMPSRSGRCGGRRRGKWIGIVGGRRGGRLGALWPRVWQRSCTWRRDACLSWHRSPSRVAVWIRWHRVEHTDARGRLTGDGWSRFTCHGWKGRHVVGRWTSRR